MLQFYKYQGTGNDFIIIDSFSDKITLSPGQIQKMCHRQFGIGADGLMILRKRDGFDFEMDFYNSDGYPGSMCGNGGRCITAFAYDQGLITKNALFWAPDGKHESIFESYDKISLKMTSVSEIDKHEKGLFLNTGSPHLVILKNSATEFDVFNDGKSIRNSKPYQQKGVNVNFVIPNPSISTIYTYERGVENQTFSCGTGTVAAALSLNKLLNFKSPVHFTTLGGELQVSFEKIADNTYENIWLIGPAYKIFEGLITV